MKIRYLAIWILLSLGMSLNAYAHNGQGDNTWTIPTQHDVHDVIIGGHSYDIDTFFGASDDWLSWLKGKGGASFNWNGIFDNLHDFLSDLKLAGWCWDKPPCWPSKPPVSAVPEPQTYAMLLAGLVLMGGLARRRKQQRG